MAVKYVFVTGGVVSGLGKGITAASLGRLLKARGYQVTMQKFDPYINIDPGTMNPIQHGEVFVTDDGTETDLDLGHYERFIDESLDKNSNVTTGKIYWTVLQKERHGDFGGGTVQVIPHITNEIKARFYRAKSPDEDRIAIIEVGGTVGDIESQPFLEAIRQFRHEIGYQNSVLIHVTLVPYLKASGELKTKPTQQSVKALQGMGIFPDVIVCRTEVPLEDGIESKIALFCNVPEDHVLQNLDVEYLYEAPLAMEKERLAQVVCECLNIPCPEPQLGDWKQMVDALKNPTSEVTIALVGKYIQLHDAYLSVMEALKHGGIANRTKVSIKWVDSEFLTPEILDDTFAGVDGIIIPGGFGSRGTEGMILAANYARENKIPFLGICLGMQMLFEESDEVRPCRGLGLLPGRIERIETSLKLPQIGWNALDILRPNAMTEGLENGSYVYFVHSFMAHPADENDLAAVTDYGTRVPAMVARGNLFGCQFHPEKSGEVGLQMLRNFAKLTEVGK